MKNDITHVLIKLIYILLHVYVCNFRHLCRNLHFLGSLWQTRGETQVSESRHFKVFKKSGSCSLKIIPSKFGLNIKITDKNQQQYYSMLEITNFYKAVGSWRWVKYASQPLIFWSIESWAQTFIQGSVSQQVPDLTFYTPVHVWRENFSAIIKINFDVFRWINCLGKRTITCYVGDVRVLPLHTFVVISNHTLWAEVSFLPSSARRVNQITDWTLK